MENTTEPAVTNSPIAYWQEAFYTNYFSIAAGSNIIFSLFGVLVELLFIVGVYPLLGWKSDFSFVIIMCIALCGLQRDIISAVNCSLTLIGVLNPDENNRQTLVRTILGNLYYIPHLTVVPINVSLSAHRFIYTLFPLQAQYYCNRDICKIWLVSILVIHMGFFIFMTCFDVSCMIWYPTLLYVAVWENSKNPYLIMTLNEYSTYLSGGFNLIAFPILFIILFTQGQLTFKKNHELRLTLHVTYVVAFETYLAAKSYFQWQKAGAPNGEDILITILLSGAYFCAIISPYLILNRNIRKRICCFEDSRSLPNSVIAARSQRSSKDRKY